MKYSELIKKYIEKNNEQKYEQIKYEQIKYKYPLENIMRAFEIPFSLDYSIPGACALIAVRYLTGLPDKIIYDAFTSTGCYPVDQSFGGSWSQKIPDALAQLGIKILEDENTNNYQNLYKVVWAKKGMTIDFFLDKEKVKKAEPMLCSGIAIDDVVNIFKTPYLEFKEKAKPSDKFLVSTFIPSLKEGHMVAVHGGQCNSNPAHIPEQKYIGHIRIV